MTPRPPQQQQEEDRDRMASNGQQQDDEVLLSRTRRRPQIPSSSDDAENNNNPLTEPLLPPPDIDHEEEVDGFVPVVDSACIFAPDPKRYIVLLVYCLCNLIASAEWITFAPIEDAVKLRYQISSADVNWLSVIFMVLYGPGTAMAAYGIRKFGLRESVVWGGWMMAVGSLLRWWSIYCLKTPTKSSSWAYPVLLTGQALVALGQPVFANTPARVAAAWFSHTTLAIGVTVFAATIGMVFGTMAPLVVSSDGHELGPLLMWQALAMVLCAVATWWWFETEPVIPPSAAEAVRRRDIHHNNQHHEESLSLLWKDVVVLCKDPQYMIMIVAFGIGYGVNNAQLTLLQPWIASVGFPKDQTAGLCGSLSIVGGVLGTAIAAPLLDATRNYKQAIHWSFLVAFIVAVAAVATLQPTTPVWLLATAFTAMGMSQLPLLTICLDAVAAHTYPINEELSSAGLQLVGQYLGVAFVDIMQKLLTHAGDHGGNQKTGFAAPINMAFLGLLGASAATALFYNGEDPRANANNTTVATTTESEVMMAGNDQEDEESEL